jgi:hypothetical protein
VGGAYIAPLYFFIHYVESDILRYSSAEMRRVEKLNFKTILLTIGIAYVVPALLMFRVHGLENRQWINGVFFQPFPIYAFAIQKFLQTFSPPKEKDQEKSIKEKDSDYFALRMSYHICGALPYGAYLFHWMDHPSRIPQIFFSNIMDPSAEHTMLYGAAKVLRYDQICMFSAGIVWTLLHFWDLKRAGFVTASWVKIVGVFGGAVVICGPGAAMALMWNWRECVIRIDPLPERELESASRSAD